MSIEEIEAAITSLDPDELRQLRVWFDKYDARSWDTQIERDASSGKLDALAEKALRQHQEGLSREL